MVTAEWEHGVERGNLGLTWWEFKDDEWIGNNGGGLLNAIQRARRGVKERESWNWSTWKLIGK